MKFRYLFLLLLFAGCALNADQEATLNSAMSDFVRAHNDGTVMPYVAAIHPNVVKYYKELGDSTFQEKFELKPLGEGGDFIQDGNIRETSSKGDVIHVRYSFLSIADEFDMNSGRELEIIAVSEDDGVSWNFVEMRDYKNDKIFPKDRRLIDP